MQKKLDIPYYSQHKDVKGNYWQKRSCGAICLKMVLDFYNLENISPDEFIQNALKEDAYGPSGWIHDKLIGIAKKSGAKAKRKEYKPKTIGESEVLYNQGVSEIIHFIDSGKPVIASAIKKWEEEKKFHMVILTGYEKDEKGNLKGFYYLDPDYNNEEEGKDLFVDEETFKKYWRRLAIFVG